MRGRRPKNPVEGCVICLYALGMGVSIVQRKTGVNKKLVKQWAVRAGIYKPKKYIESAFNAVKRREMQSRPIRVSLKKASKPPKTKEEKRAIAKARYHADISASRRKGMELYRRHRVKIYARQQANPMLRVRRTLRTRMWKAITYAPKNQRGRSMRLTGCSSAFLKDWLSKGFKRGMSWSNYGTVWHIDHILPCASFDLTKPSEQLKCFHYSNLQPLLVADNLAKHASIPTCQPELAMPL